MPALNRIKIAYALPDWVSSYSRAQVLTDLVAGLSLAAFVVPKSLAYASLAGLAPVAGLYCYLAAGFVYPLFGTSKQLAVGPTSAIAVVVAAGLAIAAAGDQARHTALAAATAISLGLICFAARMLRVAQISNFISDTILLGFKTGTALYIVSTQLPKLFGLHGGHGNFFQRIAYLWRELPQAHWPSVALGVFTLALFLILERLFPKRPTTIFVVGLSIAISSFFGLAQYGIEVVGRLPQGSPHVSLPVVDIADLDVVISVAFACFFWLLLKQARWRVPLLRNITTRSTRSVNSPRLACRTWQRDWRRGFLWLVECLSRPSMTWEGRRRPSHSCSIQSSSPWFFSSSPVCSPITRAGPCRNRAYGSEASRAIREHSRITPYFSG